MACLKGFGKNTFLKRHVSSLVNDGRRISIYLLTRNVGQRSKEHIFFRRFLNKHTLICNF